MKKLLTMTTIIMLPALSVFAQGADDAKARMAGSKAVSGHRRVEGQTVISESLPKVRIEVDPSFEYLGRVEMNTMNGKAKAEQFIFSRVKQGKLGETVIVHFEYSPPSSEFTFNYPRLKMVKLGEHEFLNQTWALRNAELFNLSEVKEFLVEKKVKAESDWLMNRYVRVVDESKKHELILFYLEPASFVSIPIGDLAQGGKANDKWPEIVEGLIRRSYKSFSIVEC